MYLAVGGCAGVDVSSTWEGALLAGSGVWLMVRGVAVKAGGTQGDCACCERGAWEVVKGGVSVGPEVTCGRALATSATGGGRTGRVALAPTERATTVAVTAGTPLIARAALAPEGGRGRGVAVTGMRVWWLVERGPVVVLAVSQLVG